MLGEEKAYLILAEKIEILKGHTHYRGKEKQPLPEFYHGYNEVVKEYNSIRVHSMPGVFPDILFAERSPNATTQEWDYAKKNYQQTSNLPVFMDTVATVSRAFNDFNITYDTQNPASEDYREYVESGVPVFYSVENYVVHVLPANKMRDAMGVTVVKPKISYKAQDDMLVEDDQELRKPEILYYETPNIWSNSDEYYFVIKTEDYCKLEDDKSGMIIWVVDDTNFYVFNQKRKEADYYFELVETIPHNTGYVPVSRLKGVPVIKDAKLIWQSQFLFAVPSLNSVVLDESYLQISKYKVGYPTRIIAGNICEFIDPKTNDPCYNGFLGLPGSENYRECHMCKGSGQKARLSPQGELLIKGKTRETEAEDVNNVLKYVSPDTEPMKFLRDEINSNLKHARAILHLISEGDPSTGENVIQSNNQNKSLNAFIKPISDQMFATYEWILNVMGLQRYGENYPKPNVVYPQTFEFLSDKDYLFLIKEAQASGAPPFVIHSLIWKYLSSIFYTDIDAAKIAELIMSTDRLVTLTTDEIQKGLINKTIEPWEKVLHDSAIKFVIELQKEPTFWNDNTDRTTLLINLAKARASEIKASTTFAPAIPDFTQPVV